jgi:hypothetical protein
MIKKQRQYRSIHSIEDQTLNKMQYHLALIVFSIFYLSINAQSANNATVIVVVQNVTVVETTVAPTTQHVMMNQTTMPSKMNTTANVAHKAIASSYVEPPPHPLGYCIRSRLSCSKIRRCCQGPCNVVKRKCP